MSDFNFDIVKNPEIFQQNRLPAHSDHEWFAHARASFSQPSDCKVNLNGLWKFSYAPNPGSAVPGFEKKEYDCHGWAEIHVPGHIQMQGYDCPQYANTQYPWDGREEVEPGEIPLRFNPTASYVKYFTLPDFMAGQRVYISFQGVESGFALWLNGEYIGYSEDSFTPSEFELTPFLLPGENKLSLQVYKWTAGSWCEDQDFFRFSGIHRDVYLFVEPRVHLKDLKIQTILAEEKGKVSRDKAILSLSCQVRGKGSLTAKLTDSDVILAEGWTDFSEAGEDLTGIRLELAIKDPVQLWSAENPYLYDLTLELRDEQGELTETVPERVGFRCIEIRDGIMYLNGERIVFKGVNRHEFCSSSGRVITPDMIRKDLTTMKRSNINAIRTSHYPNSSVFYRLCDEYGLYVIDETNLETHGVWDAIGRGLKPLDYCVPGNRPEYAELVLDRARSMYERDKNHACILIWSCGNESFGGKDILNMADYLRSTDGTRPVHYEGACRERDTRYPQTSDIESTMYTPAADMEEYLKEHREKPVILCEYTHAMGNSCGAMHKYTDLLERYPHFQGGFIWDYIDQSITRHDRYGREYQAYGGDFGERPCDYSFSGNGIVYGRDRDPSPKLQEVRFNYQNFIFSFCDEEGKKVEEGWPVQICIKNLNLFTDASCYVLDCLLEKEGRLVESIPGSLSCPPGDTVMIRNPFALPEEDGEYALTLSLRLKEDMIWAEAGHEIAWGQQVVRVGMPRRKASMQTDWGKTPLRVTHGWWNLGVGNDDFEVLFSTLHGGLVSYRYGGEELLKDIPRPNFWRAMTDNDTANLLPFRAGQWKAASMFSSTKTDHGRGATPYQVEEKEDSVTVRFTYHLPVRPARDCRVTYTVTGDGMVRTDLELDECSQVGELPEFSMLFTLDGKYSHLCWYGLGPDETYQDRCHARLGVYRNQVKDNLARYLVPQECGNKMKVRWAVVTDDDGKGLYFDCQELCFSALPYTPQELDHARHSNELPLALNTYIRVGTQMGVGGDDTWGALTHPEYMIDNTKPLRLSFSFGGILYKEQ